MKCLHISAGHLATTYVSTQQSGVRMIFNVKLIDKMYETTYVFIGIMEM